jgi:multiple sugar transport system permease protein
MTLTASRLAPPSPPVRRRRARLGWLKHVLLIALLIVMLYPILWMIGSSFKPNNAILSDISPLPGAIDLSNYIDGWNAGTTTFGVFFANSFLIAILAVIGNLFACSLTAYAFARMRFRGRNLFFGIMLVSIMLPAHAMLIPQYFLYLKLGWVSTTLPLVVPKFLGTDAFFIFLIVQFIRSLPRELDEAAAVDGCGTFRIFWSIMLPLMRPALITTGIFTFIWTYNDFFSQLIYLSSPSSRTVPVALAGYVDASGGAQYGQMLAMSVLSILPTLIVFVITQKRLVEGVATTGLRG